MSQENCIKEHLESGKSLTPIDALNMFGCFRLSGRILDLRRKGMKIKTEIVEKNDKRFARYVLEAK